MAEEEQKGVDAYHALPWIKRVSKKHKLDRDAHVLNLGNFAKDVADIDSEIGELTIQNQDMIAGYNQFVKALANVNIQPLDVIDEYHRIKDMLEKKARGEWVEEIPVVEAVPQMQESAIIPEASVHEDAIPAQNLKSNPRLTQRQKFERRLAITAQKSTKPDPTCMPKQPGDN